MGQKYVYNPLTCEYDIVDEGAPGAPGPRGPIGRTGQGVPTGGDPGQVLAKVSADDYDTEWVSGGGSASLQDVVNISGVLTDSYIVMNGGGFTVNDTYGNSLSTVMTYGSISLFDHINDLSAGGQNTLVTPGMIRLQTLNDTTGIQLEIEDQHHSSIAILNNSVDSRSSSKIKSANADEGLQGNVYIPVTPGGAWHTLATREWVYQSGTTAERPASAVVGQMYFDTTLGQPIWYNGQWVDITGTGV